MSLEPGLLTPLERSDGRRTAVQVHDVLRALILSGRLKPGTVLSQVEVGRQLQVSRTPVREALRMLQEAGLVSGEPNLRCRVEGFNPDDIESLYIKRILLETFGVSLTTRAMSGDEADALARVIAELEGEDAHATFLHWQSLHRELHTRMVASAGDAFIADMRELELRSARYQSAYKGQHLAGWWQRGEEEHRAIGQAMIARDADKAAELAARHLARTALELLAALAPEHDTAALRQALRFAVSAAKAA